MVVGARDILVAFNVWLGGDDVAAARAIAAAVRESGGGLPAVQALGMRLGSRGVAQVSLNLLDYRVTPIPVAFDRVRADIYPLRLWTVAVFLFGALPLLRARGIDPGSRD